MKKEEFEKIYVIDTNIVLADASSIKTLSDNSQNLIVIPETVLDEIDSKKSGFDEINFQAREFARILESLENFNKIDIDKNIFIMQSKIEFDDGETLRIDIIGKKDYETKVKNVPLNVYNDRKILEIAQYSKEYYKTEKLLFLSLDAMARVRAKSFDINSNTMTGDDNDKLNFVFLKDLKLSKEDTKNSIDNKFIKDYDKDYTDNNFSYMFTFPDGDQALGVIKNEKINLIDEESLRKCYIPPANREQLLFTHAMLDNFFNVIIVNAKAGSGKTLLSLSRGINLVSKKKEYNKIIYIRNSAESLDRGEDVGYLSGNEEKFKIYNHPLHDSIENIARKKLERKKNGSSGSSDVNQNNFEELVETETNDLIVKNNIETMWVGEMRGRTLSNSFVIVDEAQNMSNKTMQLVLSRIDKTCKVVILGSHRQIDNFYVNKYTNSLTTLLKSTIKKDENINVFSVELLKVLRGPITEWAEKIFSK